MPQAAIGRARWAPQALFVCALLYTICVYGTMATMSIAAGLVGAVWLFSTLPERGALSKDWRRMRESFVFAPSVWLGVACLWSLVWAKYSGLEFFGMKPTVTWDDTRKAWHLAFTFILFAVFARLRENELKAVVKTWIGVGLASALLGVVQHWLPIYEPMQMPHTMHAEYVPPPGLIGMLSGKYHATGLSGFHLSYAAIIGFPTAIFMALAAVLIRREGFTRRTWLVLAALALCLAANVLTFSKTAWAAVPLTALLIIFLGLKGRVRYALVTLVVVSGIAWASSPVVRERFADNHARSIIEREMIWSANIEMIKQFPLFGVGWHRNSELSAGYYRTRPDVGSPFESHAHNNLLDQWSTTGLFGLVTFVWLNVVLVLAARRLYLSRHELLWRVMGLGLVGGWVCLHLNGMTQANWWDAKVLHQLSWVTALTMELVRRYGKKRSKAGVQSPKSGD